MEAERDKEIELNRKEVCNMHFADTCYGGHGVGPQSLARLLDTKICLAQITMVRSVCGFPERQEGEIASIRAGTRRLIPPSDNAKKEVHKAQNGDLAAEQKDKALKDSSAKTTSDGAEETECSICFNDWNNNERLRIFFACKHGVCCLTCALELAKTKAIKELICPICRQDIKLAGLKTGNKIKSKVDNGTEIEVDEFTLDPNFSFKGQNAEEQKLSLDVQAKFKELERLLKFVPAAQATLENGAFLSQPNPVPAAAQPSAKNPSVPDEARLYEGQMRRDAQLRKQEEDDARLAQQLHDEESRLSGGKISMLNNLRSQEDERRRQEAERKKLADERREQEEARKRRQEAERKRLEDERRKLLEDFPRVREERRVQAEQEEYLRQLNHVLQRRRAALGNQEDDDARMAQELQQEELRSFKEDAPRVPRLNRQEGWVAPLISEAEEARRKEEVERKAHEDRLAQAEREYEEARVRSEQTEAVLAAYEAARAARAQAKADRRAAKK